MSINSSVEKVDSAWIAEAASSKESNSKKTLKIKEPSFNLAEFLQARRKTKASPRELGAPERIIPDGHKLDATTDEIVLMSDVELRVE